MRAAPIIIVIGILIMRVMITAAVHLGLLLIVLVLSHLHNLFFYLFSLFLLCFLPLFPSHCYTSLDGDLNLLNLGLIAFALGN